MSKSAIFFILCLAFISGIAAHSFFSPFEIFVEPAVLYGIFLGLAGLVVFLIFLKSENQRWIYFAVASIFILGMFQYSRQQSDPQDSNTVAASVGLSATITGKISEFPRFREKNAAYIITPEDKTGLPAQTGKILLTIPSFPKYKFGEVLRFTCKFNALDKYEEYSRRFGVQASCAFPQYIGQVAKNSEEGFRSKLFQVREAFHGRLNSLFPAPYGGLLAGILYGDTSGFSSQLKETFRITGISHITALSGYNVTVIAGLLMNTLIFFWLTRKQALPLALLIIFGFVIVTGAEASVVRAAIMGFLVLGAKGIGRLTRMHIALALAGAVMLAINPYLLRFDLGFQLSFLATIALIWLADDFAKHSLLRFLPKILGIREAGAASAAAIILTLPLLLHTTGLIGPFSLLTNILIVPIIPFAMGFGFFAVVADFLFHPLGAILALGARLLLQFILGVADYFSTYGAWERQVSATAAALVFLLIVTTIYFWQKNLHNYLSR